MKSVRGHLQVEKYDGVDDLLHVGGGQEGRGQVGAQLELIRPLGQADRLDLVAEVEQEVEEGRAEEQERHQSLVRPPVGILSHRHHLAGRLGLLQHHHQLLLLLPLLAAVAAVAGHQVRPLCLSETRLTDGVFAQEETGEPLGHLGLRSE